MKNCSAAPSEKGFTIIELVIVILIIGILSTIAMLFYSNHRKAAIDATIQSDVVNASRTIATWDIENAGATRKIPGPDSKLAKDLRLSSHNRVIIRGNSADYCIIGTNPGGDLGVKGIVYSSLHGGLNKDSECGENYIPSSEPTNEGSLIVWESEVDVPKPSDPDSTSPGDPEVPAPPLTPPADGLSVTCGDIAFTAKAGTFVNCEHLASNNKQDVFKLISGSHSKTDIRWEVGVDITNMPGKVSSNLEVPHAFAADKIDESRFSVYGKGSSGKGQPASDFVSDKKSHVFIVKVAWK